MIKTPEEALVTRSSRSDSKSCSDVARTMLRAKVMQNIQKSSPAKLHIVGPFETANQEEANNKAGRQAGKPLQVQTSTTAGLPTPPSSSRLVDGVSSQPDGQSIIEQTEENIIKDPQVYLSAIKQYVSQIFPQLPLTNISSNNNVVQHLIITCEDHVNFPGIGPVHPARMVLSADGSYSFQCLFMPIDKGSLFDRAAVTANISKLASSSGHVLCPGVINYEELSQALQIANLNISNLVRLWGFPFSRIDSVNCSLWHLPHPLPNDKVESSFQNVCYYCKSTFLGLLCLTKGVRGHEGAINEVEDSHTSSDNTSKHKHSNVSFDGLKRKRLERKPIDDQS